MRGLFACFLTAIVAVIGLACSDPVDNAADNAADNAVANVTLAEVTSGLQPGDSAGVFHVLDCTGASAGEKTCYR